MTIRPLLSAAPLAAMLALGVSAQTQAQTSAALEARSNVSWNPYALATVAFLKKDRAAFDQQHEAQRQATQRHAENRGNLDVLDRLDSCFDQPYAKAYDYTAPEAAT